MSQSLSLNLQPALVQKTAKRCWWLPPNITKLLKHQLPLPCVEKAQFPAAISRGKPGRTRQRRSLAPWRSSPTTMALSTQIQRETHHTTGWSSPKGSSTGPSCCSNRSWRNLKKFLRQLQNLKKYPRQIQNLKNSLNLKKTHARCTLERPKEAVEMRS